MEVIGSKRANSSSPIEDLENRTNNEDKKIRKFGDKSTNLADFIIVSVPDDGRRTKVTIRSVDNFRQARIADENFLVWSCSKGWRDLKEHAKILMSKSENQSNTNSSSLQLNSNNSELWLRKYSPLSYVDLVSDEATNRTVLQWMRLWDKGVFGKERKSRLSAGGRDRNQQSNANPQQQQNGGKWQNNTFRKGPKGPEMDSTESWPAQRICLLTGPPGLGKTTLAHIIARHCGYEIVEVNASDDRTAGVFRDYLESVVETRGMLNAVLDGDGKQVVKPKPACLIMDEIDGAPQAAVDVLVSYVTSEVTEKAEKGAKKKNKKSRELRRPVICICNDQYASSLRNLRKYCFVVTCQPPPPERLVFRLGEIARRERLDIDTHASEQIVERSRGDIRVCINILQTLKAAAASNVNQQHSHDLATQQRRHRSETIRITSEQIARLPRLGFNKDTEQSMFDCLGTIFKLLPPTSPVSRFDTIQNSVQMNTDHEMLVNGIFDNYLHARIRDDFLIAASSMADWLALADTLQSSAMSLAGADIGFAMTYITTPLIATACHLMFANSQPHRLAFPKHSIDMRQMQTQRNNQLSSFMAGMNPSEKVFFSSPVAVIFDLLPSLIDIIQPSLRPVSTQLFSMAEKMEISRVVEVMSSLGLTFVQRLAASSTNENWQNRGSQLGFYLEPPVDCFVVYERRSLPPEGYNKFAAHQDNQDTKNPAITLWRLPQAIRQYLGGEILLYLARRAAIRSVGPVNPPNENDEAESKPSTTASVLAEKDKAHMELIKQFEAPPGEGDQKVQTAISSFFTRSSSSKANKNTFNSVLKSPPGSRSRDKIWYRFNEGYSNAVRRPAKVKQFF